MLSNSKDLIVKRVNVKAIDEFLNNSPYVEGFRQFCKPYIDIMLYLKINHENIDNEKLYNIFYDIFLNMTTIIHLIASDKYPHKSRK